MKQTRLTDEYLFKRRLSTSEEALAHYTDRDYAINSVKPVKEIVILDPGEAFPHLNADGSIQVGDTPSKLLSKNNPNFNWPFRIQYPEQILDTNEIWIVTADHRQGINAVYNVESDALTQNIQIGIEYFQSPAVIFGTGRNYQSYRDFGEIGAFILDEKELKQLDYDPKSLLNDPYHIIDQGIGNTYKCIELAKTNICPVRDNYYNCTFYHREVANLYAESLHTYFHKAVEKFFKSDEN